MVVGCWGEVRCQHATPPLAPFHLDMRSVAAVKKQGGGVVMMDGWRRRSVRGGGGKSGTRPISPRGFNQGHVGLLRHTCLFRGGGLGDLIFETDRPSSAAFP